MTITGKSLFRLMRPYIVVSSILLTMTGCAAGVTTKIGSQVEQMCAATVNDYFIAVDAADGQRTASLFTEDAVLELPSRTLKGPVEIDEYFSNPAPGRVLRHHLTSRDVQRGADGSATGSIYVLMHVLAAATEESEASTALVSGVYDDDYVIRDGRCLFQRRKLDVLIVTRG